MNTNTPLYARAAAIGGRPLVLMASLIMSDPAVGVTHDGTGQGNEDEPVSGSETDSEEIEAATTRNVYERPSKGLRRPVSVSPVLP